MTRAALVLLCCGCMTQAWTPPQPYFRTVDPDNAWVRTVEATKQHCGGVTSANEEAGIVIGAWELWNTGDGLIITQCIVSLLRGDERVRDVRVTFSSRRCPLSDMNTPVEELVKTCELSDTVPEQVKNGLEVTGQKLEKSINAVARAIER
jgi:hypothetical protein